VAATPEPPASTAVAATPEPPASTAVAGTPEPPAGTAVVATPEPTPFIYVVQPGDSLAKVAEQFNTTVQELIEENDIADAARIAVGQELVIPGQTPPPVASPPPPEETQAPATPTATAPAEAAEEPVVTTSQIEKIRDWLPLRAIVGVALVFVALLVLPIAIRLLAWLLYVARRAAAPYVLPLLRLPWRMVRYLALRLLRRPATGFARPDANLQPLAPGGQWPAARGEVRSAASAAGSARRGAAASARYARRAWSARRRLAPLAARLWVAAAAGLVFVASRMRPVALRAWALARRAMDAALGRPPPAPALSDYARAQLTSWEMQRALESGELAVHYRPVFRAANETVARAAAVLRTKHPVYGWNYTQPIADTANAALGRLLAKFVFDNACEFAGQYWEGPQPSPRLTVGVSRKQLLDPTLVSVIGAALENGHFANNALEIEVSEPAIADESDGADAALRRLRRLGVTIALDDFTGTLSPGLMERLDIASVKVDFSDGTGSEDARQSVEAAVRIGQSLGLDVTANRVESTDEVQLARELGCTYMEGDALATPLPPESFEAGDAEGAEPSVVTEAPSPEAAGGEEPR
jgi:EAL domain-containing protein (putative c-di-GMP-specific phosphodiesterase class I)/LysM repeat protein